MLSDRANRGCMGLEHLLSVSCDSTLILIVFALGRVAMDGTVEFYGGFEVSHDPSTAAASAHPPHPHHSRHEGERGAGSAAGF